MCQKSQADLPKIGYKYHDPSLDHPGDHFRLNIHIFLNPSEQHFDVKFAHFFAKTKASGIERLSISHPWNFEKTARVCAGLVEMEDRKGKKEEAFTFGGHLEVQTQEALTTCTLLSSAPILEISGATPMHALFIEEVEILLAERQADHAVVSDFEKKLINADPQELYLACLHALIRKFESFPNKDQEYVDFVAYLHQQKYRLEVVGFSNDPIRGLGEIL